MDLFIYAFIVFCLGFSTIVNIIQVNQLRNKAEILQRKNERLEAEVKILKEARILLIQELHDCEKNNKPFTDGL